MKRRRDGFIWIGLGISLLMALFISPFASSSPDGLDKISEIKGFAEKGGSWQFWKYAPLPDYAIRSIKNEKISTALSGLIGTFAIFFIVLGIGKLIKKGPTKKISILILLFLSISSASNLGFSTPPLSKEDTGTVEQKKPSI